MVVVDVIVVHVIAIDEIVEGSARCASRRLEAKSKPFGLRDQSLL